MGRGTAQRGAGPERLKDELSSPRLSPWKLCLMQFPSRDPVWTDSQHVPKGDPMAVPEPDATTAPRHPRSPGGSVPQRATCAPSRVSRSSPAPRLWRRRTPGLAAASSTWLSWQKPVTLGDAVSSSLVAPPPAQTPPSPSEPASQEPSAKWGEVPFGTGSLGQDLWASQAFHWSILDVGNPRGSLR